MDYISHQTLPHLYASNGRQRQRKMYRQTLRQLMVAAQNLWCKRKGSFMLVSKVNVRAGIIVHSLTDFLSLRNCMLVRAHVISQLFNTNNQRTGAMVGVP